MVTAADVVVIVVAAVVAEPPAGGEEEIVVVIVADGVEVAGDVEARTLVPLTTAGGGPAAS